MPSCGPNTQPRHLHCRRNQCRVATASSTLTHLGSPRPRAVPPAAWTDTGSGGSDRVRARPWILPLDRLNRWEAEFVERRAALSPAEPPAALTRISAFARGGRLWFVIAALMAARPGNTRRAAADGVLAILLASSSAQTLNRVVARPRPSAGHLPAHQALVHQPTTASFPSSHSAVAAAFTTAAGRRSPAIGLALAPLACTIAYARIRTRAHWPTDVLAGLALGAIAGELVHRHTLP
jgi:acid phosphatase family membrane protein YuiD